MSELAAVGMNGIPAVLGRVLMMKSARPVEGSRCSEEDEDVAVRVDGEQRICVYRTHSALLVAR